MARRARPHITLPIPHEEDFYEVEATMLVPQVVVEATIDLLQGIVAQWKKEEADDRDERVWSALMSAAGLCLGGLIAAQAARVAKPVLGPLLDEVERCLEAANARELLLDARTADNAPLVDALLARREESERHAQQRP